MYGDVGEGWIKSWDDDWTDGEVIHAEEDEEDGGVKGSAAVWEESEANL